MSKKPLVGVVIAVIVAGILIVSFNNQDSEISSSRVDLSHSSQYIGDLNAPITIVEFGDYQCEMCGHWYHNTRPLIISNYVDTGKANLVFVDLPFLGSDSAKASQASYCAEDQDKYWEFHNALYESQQGIDNGWASKVKLRVMAKNLGLDVKIFEECLYSDKHLDRVMYNKEESNKQRIQATPTFIILNQDNLQVIKGAQPYTTFQRVLDELS